MKVEEYIASGILESYVLGGLTALEIQELEAMALKHPEVKKELLILQDAFGYYAESIAIKPSSELKNKILSRINYQSLNSATSNNNQLNYYKYATAASVALMIVCGGLASLFWSKWQGAEQRLTAMEEQTSSYANQITKTNYKINQLVENLNLVKDSSVVKITMIGLDSTSNALSVVFWNKSTNEVFIDTGNLPQAPDGMQYQLWAISLEGTPVDAGVFEMDQSIGLQKVKSITNAQAYAVTLEKRGGSLVPTLSSMFVFGKV